MNKDGRWSFTGDKIQLPETYNMAKVPAGGYPDNITGEFNKKYTELLNSLNTAWNTDNGKFNKTLAPMRSLTKLARELMEKKIDGSAECYGPDFRFVP